MRSLLIAVLFVLELSVSPTAPAMGQKEERTISKSVKSTFFDDFQRGKLSPDRWKPTRQNDFRKSVVDVTDVGEGDFRLRMTAETTGTRDDTVKFHGVRSLKKVVFAEGKKISLDLDWNDQANGCYLTAGLYLCPTVTDTNPRDEPDWIKFEYVGVPPGRNARFQVVTKNRGNLKFLFREGWPDRQRTGRKITLQQLELLIDGKGLIVIENNREIFRTEDHGIRFPGAFLYLQMSSHSNYPARTIYFDNIRISSN